MSILEALVLGIVQGLTEFLPISSKSHLIIIPALMGWRQPPIPFIALLHAGTLIAALVYFRHELVESLDGIQRPSPGRKLIGLLILGTIPAAIIGITFEKRITALFENPPLAALALVVTGVILALTETFFRIKKRDESIEETAFSNVEKMALEVTPAKSFFVGLCQSLALLPGISRAGVTISGGLLAGLSRPQAARFSFMLSLPIIAGTALAEVPRLSELTIGLLPIIVGFLASLVAGYAAIAGMIGYLQKRGLYPFAAYCLVVGPIVSFILSR